MSVTVETSISGPYVPNGVTTEFAFDFKAASASEVQVVHVLGDVQAAVPSADYDVSLNESGGGSVVFTVAPLTGSGVLYIASSPDFTRSADFSGRTPFSVATVNDELDRSVVRDIALRGDVDRALKVPVGATAPDYADFTATVKGDPGGSPQAIGTFTAAATHLGGAGFDIPTGIDVVATDGYSALDSGSALYVYDAAVDASYVAANPTTSFISLEGRGFRLSADQRVTPEALGFTGDANIYVRTDGLDTNTGLANSAAGAFRTIQAAVDFAREKLDFNGHNVVVHVAGGAYTAGFSISGPHIGKGSLFIFGNVMTPANCPVNVTGADAFHAENGATIWLRGFKPSTTTSGACVVAYTGATINMQAMDFGACAAAHIEAGTGGTISLDGPYTISGSAVSHLHCGSFGGIFSAGSFTVTIAGTPAFSSYFAGVAQGSIVIPGMTFSGSATGPRYLAHHGGYIQAAAISPALPGDVAGRADTGGHYVASVVDPVVEAPDPTLNSSRAMRGVNIGTGAQVDRVVTRADATGSGSFYFNSDDCYSSGETQFGNTVRTTVFSGTQDGATFYSKAALGGGGVPVAEMSNNGFAVMRWRRRTSDGNVHEFTRDTTLVGSISVTATATAFNTSSDYRLKEDARPIDDPVGRILALRPINFAWKTNGERTDGFLAHELAEVVPQAVTGEKDAEDAEGNPVYQGVDQAKLVPLLVAAVQHLNAQVSALQDVVQP